jgi:glycosyltransferase involved in cell wall biosynthesis
MNLPCVSIITPTYNHENYIADCIRSVQAQTFSDWEMILVDDGSIDMTLSVAQSFAKEDKRIKVFTQQNIGIFRLSETYNFALSHAKGKYIAILEGDDVWLPNKLALQLVALEKDDEIVLSFGQAYSSSSDLSENYTLTKFKGISENVLHNFPHFSATRALLFSNYIVALTVVIRKSVLDRIGGFKQCYNLPLVDLPTWIELSLYGKFSCIHEPLGRWRIYPNQITKTYTAEIHESFYLFAKDFYHNNLDIFSSSSGITSQHLKSHFYRRLVEAHSRSGRYKLIRKDFTGARQNYLKSIFCFGLHEPIWKLRSVVGYVFSLFRTDIETMARIVGRVSYK